MTVSIPPARFTDPDFTAKGETRASVAFRRLETLWVMTGTLCNIECAHCYIESSPANDRLVYLSEADLTPFLDEIDQMGAGPVEIGFTGGEPFMNPEMVRLMEMALERGHSVLVLTNAMRPMMRPKVQQGLSDLNRRFPARITMRISFDHHAAEGHDAERGPGGFAASCEGTDWLAREGFRLAVAGRSLTGESEDDARAGFASLFAQRGWDIDPQDRARLVIFPEMDPSGEPPEITTECWSILGVDPSAVMCASARMIARRKGEDRAKVLACTLIPYDEAFELADTLEASFAPVKLNHRFCAQFCVLGGASCSG